MCVLASVRNFSVVCFLRVRSNSVCGSLSVRSGTTSGRNATLFRWEECGLVNALWVVVAPGRNFSVVCFE